MLKTDSLCTTLWGRYTYIYIYIYLCVCVMCIYMCVCVYMCVCACVWANKHICNPTFSGTLLNPNIWCPRRVRLNFALW